MSTTQRGVTGNGGGRGSRAAGAVGALLLAAALLAAGAAAPGSAGDRPSDGRLVPGKVSVLGEAKVRRWTGQTFSVEVPLEWVNIQEAREQRQYAWVLPRDETLLDSAESVRTAAGEDWGAARKLVSARLRVAVEPASTRRGARAKARAVSRTDKRYSDGFNDLGAVRFRRPDGASDGRYAFRFEIAASGTTESHYFFATCRDARREETWHLTVNRSDLSGREASRQKATLDAVLASFETVYAPSEGPRDCKG